VPDRARPAIWLIGLWSAAALALCNAIWLLMAAGIAHLRWTRREIAAPVCALLAFLAIIPAWEWAQVRAVADGCSLIGVFVMYYSGTGPWLVPLIATLSFAVPLILSAAILVRALRRRIPPGRAFREGFRGPGAWIGAACLLAYGLLVIGTAVQESHVLHERNRIRVHEGRYYAAMVGAEWPGLPAN
jgi:hypothetical protein